MCKWRLLLTIVIQSLLSTGMTSSLPISIVSCEVFTKKEASSSVQSNNLKVNATGGIGELFYRLNNGPFQKENNFTNVPAGIHRVVVEDKSNGDFMPLLITVTDEESTSWSYKNGKVTPSTKKNALVIAQIKLVHPRSVGENYGSVSIKTVSQAPVITYKLFKQGMSSSIIQENNGIFSMLGSGKYYLTMSTPSAVDQEVGFILV